MMEVPQRDPGADPLRGLAVKPPEADDIFLKIMHKYFVYCYLTIFADKKTL